MQQPGSLDSCVLPFHTAKHTDSVHLSSLTDTNRTQAVVQTGQAKASSPHHDCHLHGCQACPDALRIDQTDSYSTNCCEATPFMTSLSKGVSWMNVAVELILSESA